MHRIDEDAVIFLDGFAIWVAGMIDPARVVPPISGLITSPFSGRN
jgi:hypothetical protein